MIETKTNCYKKILKECYVCGSSKTIKRDKELNCRVCFSSFPAKD